MTSINFEFMSVPKIVCSPGSAGTLAEHCRALAITRPMLVTDKGLLATGILKPVISKLEAEGLVPFVYSDIQADPPEHIVLSAKQAAVDAGTDGIIAVGGGSSLDVAKLIAALVPGDQPLQKMYGIDQIKQKRLPLILVPTTAGTGSEVTPISIITTGETTKSGVVSHQLLPDIALLDAELTLGLPPSITAATGIDAMVHAIEAFTSKKKKNPYSDMLAKEALRLISSNLLTAVRQGNNVEARSKVLLGAMLAGQAFANAPVAAVHALAYPLGGNYHIPHGLSNALVLPHVLRFNASDDWAIEQYAQLMTCVTTDNSCGDAQLDCAHFIELVEALLIDVAIPRTLSALNIPESDLPKLANEAMQQQRLLVNNPRYLSEADALAIYQAAWQATQSTLTHLEFNMSKSILREKISKGEFVFAPGIQDMITAVVANKVGFDVVYGSGYWLTASGYGLPDAGIVSYTQMLDRMATLVKTSNAAVMADADTGFGGLLNVHHTVKGYQEAGVAAIQMEDQEFPKKCGHTPGRRVIPVDDMVEKIKVAVDARTDEDMMIIARTDALHAEGLEASIKRCNAYRRAGADIIFLEALTNEEEMRKACEAVDAPMMANMSNGGFTPMYSAEKMQDIGFSVAIAPSLPALAAANAVEKALIAMKEQGSPEPTGVPINNFKEFCSLIGFEDVWAFEKKWAK